MSTALNIIEIWDKECMEMRLMIQMLTLQN